MDASQVRERLLFLNKEIHDERFKHMELSGVISMWESAKVLYEQGRLAEAERVIEDALSILYAARRQEEAPQTSQQSPQPQAPVTQVYSETPSRGSVSDALYSIVTSFFEICWYVLVRPYHVFDFIKQRSPVSDVMLVLGIFGFVFTVNAILYLDLGFLDNLQVLFLSPVYGFILAVLASLLLKAVSSVLGFKTGLTHLFCVYGFSLVPSALIGLASIVLKLLSPGWSSSGLMQILFYLVVLVVFVFWCLVLQVAGLTRLYGMPAAKSVLAVLVVNLVVLAFVLGAGGVFIGLTIWEVDFGLF
jgi:hypothetical protein